MSSDGGAVWTQIDSWLGEGGCCIVHPQDDNIIIYGGQGNSATSNWAFGIARSTDGGTGWSRTWIQQTVRGWCRTVTVAPSEPDRVYAGGDISGSGAVAVSTDRGATWTQTATAPADTVTGLVVHPDNASRVYAATTGGVYRSTDGGATWQRIWTGTGLRAIAPYPLCEDTIAVGGDAGVYVSTDDGATWQAMNDGLDVRTVSCLEFGGPGSATLFAGTMGGAVYAWQFPTAVCEPGRPAQASSLSRATLTSGRVSLGPALRGKVVRVYDAAGRCVLETRSGVELDLTAFAPGVYTLEAGPARRRLVKVE